MTPRQWLPVYDHRVVNAFWRAHSHREIGPDGQGRTFINGIHVRADGGNTVKRFFTRRSNMVRERTLERRLHEFGLTLSDFDHWARTNYDGWSGRWIQHWEKELDEIA